MKVKKNDLADSSVSILLYGIYIGWIYRLKVVVLYLLLGLMDVKMKIAVLR